MRKMKLHLDDLAVESFAVASDELDAAGTVHARQEKTDALPQTADMGRLGTCLPGYCTCDGLPTCDYSGCIQCPPSDPLVCPRESGQVIEGPITVT